MPHQLTLDDCEPNWDDLCDLGAQQLHNPSGPTYWEARRQGLTKDQIQRITTVQLTGSYL